MESYITCLLCGERNNVIFSFCKKCGSELPSTEKNLPSSDEELPDIFDQEERRTREILFDVEKSGFVKEAYRISHLDDRDFIIARRSTQNRIGVYLFFFIVFGIIGVWGILENITDPSEFGEAFFNYIITGIFQILLCLGIMVVVNFYGNLRRITVYNENEVRIGAIRGNLFFTRWCFTESSTHNINRIQFGLFRSIGELRTPLGSFTVSSTKEIAKVMDKNGEVTFSVHSLESEYTRKRFKINSSGQLNPLLVCLASICIIERMFRPRTEPD